MRPLRIPPALRFVVLTGLAAGCSTSSGPLPHGKCTVKAPPGQVCETTCYEIATPSDIPEACEAYCEEPDAGKLAGQCTNAAGYPLLDCKRQVFDDGGARVLC